MRDSAEWSDYESDASLDEDDFMTYFADWSPTRHKRHCWQAGPDLVETCATKQEYVWEFEDVLPAKFKRVDETDKKAAELIEEFGNCWADLPDECRYDDDKPLRSVVGIHIDGDKMITGVVVCSGRCRLIS